MANDAQFTPLTSKALASAIYIALNECNDMGGYIGLPPHSETFGGRTSLDGNFNLTDVAERVFAVLKEYNLHMYVTLPSLERGT